MNRKRIIIIIAIIVIAIAPIVVVGANKFQRKNDGRTVVEVGQDISDIEDGEKLVLVAPANGKKGEEDDLERKRAYEANMYSEDNIAQPTIEKYSAEDEKERLEYEKRQEEVEKMERAIINAMYKHYDKDYVDYVFERGEQMTEKDEATLLNLLKEKEELVDMIVTTLEKGNIEKESEDAIKKFFDEADISFIENEELKTRIKNLGIEI